MPRNGWKQKKIHQVLVAENSRKGSPDTNLKSYVTDPNSVYGCNAIGKITKHVAQVCGFVRWEQCTNHGNRAYGITVIRANKNYKSISKNALSHNRHKNKNSQDPYNRENVMTSHMFQNALQYNDPNIKSTVHPPKPNKKCIIPT